VLYGLRPFFVTLERKEEKKADLSFSARPKKARALVMILAFAEPCIISGV